MSKQNNNLSSMFSVNKRTSNTEGNKKPNKISLTAGNQAVKQEKKTPVKKQLTLKTRVDNRPQITPNEILQSPQKAAEFEDYLEQEELRESEIERRQRKRDGVFRRILKTAMIAGCVYLILLIYGVFVTDFAYNKEGVIAPQVLSVSDIREKKDFEVILGQYQMCRMLFEKTLELDYRMAQGVEDQRVIAPEYSALLEANKTINVTNLAKKTEALSVSDKYSGLKEMLLSWLQNDIALYLQNISSGILQDDAEAANNALIVRDAMWNDFSAITQNIVTIGESLNGVDVTDVKEWDPNTYAEEKFNGG